MAAEASLVEAQRVDVGHQVTPVAVGRDQLDHPGVLVDDRIRVVGPPANRLVGDSQLEEDVVPELVGESWLRTVRRSRPIPRPG